MSFFETNMQVLHQKNSFLWQKLSNIQDAENFEIFMDEGDVTSLNFVNTKHFIPMYENKASLSVAEAKKKLDFFEEYPFLYFFGIGNGVLLKDLLRSIKHKRIVVIEPEIEILYIVLHMFDFSQEITSERIILLGTQEVDFTKTYTLVQNYRVHRYAKVYKLHINSAYYEKLYENEIAYTNKKLVDGFSHAISIAGNDPTDALIGLKHYVINIPNIIKTPPLRELLTKIHQCETAILVSTGPSLSKQLPLLKKIAPYVTVVAVDASFPVLYKAGIKPDAVVSMERVKESANFFTELPKEAFDDVVIALSALQHDDVIKSIKGGTVQMSLRPLAYMMHIGPEPWGYLGIGMSAANMGYELIFHAKFKNCILLGQDLAYAEDGRSHAAGHVFGEENVKTKESDFSVVAWGGRGEIKTNRIWNLFRKSFEKDISETQAHMTTINATEGGAHIDGTVEISFEDAITKYIQDTEKKKSLLLLNATKEAQLKFSCESNEKLENVFVFIKKLSSKVESLLVDLAKYSQSKDESFTPREAHKISKRIAEIKLYFKNPIYEEVVWHVAQSILLSKDLELATLEVYRVKNEAQEQKHRRFLLQTNKEWFISFAGILDSMLKTISYAKARRLLDSVAVIDVYIQNTKIDSFSCYELKAEKGRVFDVDMRGILYDVPDEYLDKSDKIVFKDAKNGNVLLEAFVSVFSRGDEKYNELSFVRSLEEPVDEEKIKDLYCKNSIGFLAIKENLEDEDFMAYVKELIVRFPQVKVKAFYFNQEEHRLLNNKFELLKRRINMIPLNGINNLCENIEMYVHNKKCSYKDLLPFFRQKTSIYAYYFVEEYKTRTLKDADQDLLKRDISYIKYPEKYGLPPKGFEQFDFSHYQFLFHYFMRKIGQHGFTLDLSTNQYEFVHFTTLEYIFNFERFKLEYLSFLKKVSLNV
jgi:hypothetical protein